MPTLNWIGKDKVVNHHLDVPFYTLEHKYGFETDEVNKSDARSSYLPHFSPDTGLGEL